MRKEQTPLRSGRSRLAQSRIDYIVYGNPGPVSKLLDDYGYEPPRSLPDLSGAVRELIRQEGKKVVIDLVRLHPDRDAILAATKNPDEKPPVQAGLPEKKEAEKKEPEKKKEDHACASCGGNHKKEDSYCGCHHSFDPFDAGYAIEKLKSLDINELLKRYENISKQATSNPEDRKLADDVMLIWNEIRQRNNNAPAEKPKELEKPEKPACMPLSYREGLLILGLTIVAGILIGVSVRAVSARQYH